VINVKAQEIEIIEVNNIKEKLPIILYSEDVKVVERDEKGNLIESQNLVRYDYPTDVKASENVIFKEYEDYSNTVILPNGKLKKYAGTPYYRNSNGDAVLIQTEYTTPTNWEEANKVSLIKSIFYTPYALAFDYYAHSSDGLVENSNANFNTCVSASTGSSAYKTNTNTTQWFGVDSGTYYCAQSFYNFDVSDIAEVLGENEITDIDFNLYIYSKAGTGSFNIYQSTQSSPTDLVVGDFGNYNTTALATAKSLTDMTTSAYNVWSGNSSMIGLISSTTQYLSLALVNTNDYLLGNTAPTDGANFGIRFSEYADVSSDPYLTITIASSTPEEEEPTATTSVDFFPCEIPENNDIGIITGCKNIYNGTTSSSTITGVEYFYYDVKFILYLFILSIIFVCLSIINIFLKENEKKKK